MLKNTIYLVIDEPLSTFGWRVCARTRAWLASSAMA